MDETTNPPLPAPAPKRQRMSLFDTFRGRNGGRSTSFVTTSNTGIMDTMHGSETEEDDEDTAQEYLNKMRDDTDRKVETVFGKGVDVWRSFGGTIYADVNDEIKKRRRDEELWGKKRKRGGKDGQAKISEQRFDSLRNSMSSADSGSASASTPSLAHSTYTDSTISYPSLPSKHDTLLPSTPTASEWEIFPVSQSQCNDFSGAPQEYRSIRTASFDRGSADKSMPGSFERPIKPLPARAQRMKWVQTTHITRSQSNQPPAVTPTPAQNTGFFGSVLGGARRIISGSFGSFDGRQADRFDERGYRLLPGDIGETPERKERDGDGGQDRKLDEFKGRPWLKKW